MKRRLVSVITVVTLVLSLVACGDKSSDESASTDVEELQKQIESLQSQVSDLQEENEGLKSKSGDTGIIDAVMDVVDPTDPDDPSTWSDDMVITFTDPKLAEITREILSLQDGNITYGMVKDIKDLRCNDCSDLESLKYFTGLQELDMDAESIGSLSAVANRLSNLSSLRMVGKPQGDFKVLCEFPNLTTLKLDVNGLTNEQFLDISELTNLKSLQLLDMGNEEIKDYSPLKKLDSLEELQIDTELCTYYSKYNDAYFKQDGDSQHYDVGSIQEFLSLL